jgi:hypothetical protein
MSEKIKPQHLARKAIFYVRQSSPYQVIHNLESQKLQYAMEARLHQLGWREIEVVDDELGRKHVRDCSSISSNVACSFLALAVGIGRYSLDPNNDGVADVSIAAETKSVPATLSTRK